MINWDAVEKVLTSEDVEKEKLRSESKLYLNETDWYIIRKLETGIEVPEDIVIKRNEARQVLSI